MYRGYLDTVTSSGFVDGWAFDDGRPTQPLLVSIRVDDDEEVAAGFANRYRADLAAAGCGTGFCAFHLRINGAISRLRRMRSTLVIVPDAVTVFSADGLPLNNENEPTLRRIEDVTLHDPTSLRGIDELAGCAALFDQIIKTSGPGAFVRAAYVYVLGRPADPAGFTHYSRMLTRRELAPFDLLRVLYDSTEFRGAPRLLPTPTEPGFVFAAP